MLYPVRKSRKILLHWIGPNSNIAIFGSFSTSEKKLNLLSVHISAHKEILYHTCILHTLYFTHNFCHILHTLYFTHILSHIDYTYISLLFSDRQTLLCGLWDFRSLYHFILYNLLSLLPDLEGVISSAQRTLSDSLYLVNH